MSLPAHSLRARHAHGRRGKGNRRSVTLAIIALTVAALVGATFLPLSHAWAESDNQEFVANGEFTQGTAGWRMNRSLDKLTTAKVGRDRSAAAVITPSTKSAVALNDVVDSVKQGAKGLTYTLTVWVRTSTPGNVVMIKGREGGPNGKHTHSTKMRLTDKGWHKVTLSFRTLFAKSYLDVNVLFWNNKVGGKVYVDSVSLMGPTLNGPKPNPGPVLPSPSVPASPSPSVSPSPTKSPSPSPSPTAPSPSPTKTAAPSPSTPPSPSTCTRPEPTGSKFGTSISTSSLTAAEALAATDSIVGRIPIVRVYDSAMAWPWSKPRAEMLSGRDLVVSFRPMPQDVLSGKYDDELRTWFRQAPSNVKIYWSYIHEPEPMIDQGKFTADQYRRAWQRIDSIADSVCRTNMYSTLILTGWTTLPASKRDWRTYYAGDNVIDVMAFDPYNGASNPTAVRGYPSAASIFDSVVKVAREAGKPYGIAETGSPRVPSDKTGDARAAWLTDVASYHRAHGALFVTYFNSSRDGEWRLLDKPSQVAWRAAVAKSTE